MSDERIIRRVKKDDPGIKPIASRISRWNNMDEVIYTCPHCTTSFAALGSSAHYCFTCGLKIDWGVIVKLDERLKEFYMKLDTFEKQKAFCKTIDDFNNEFQFSAPMKMKTLLDEDFESFQALYEANLAGLTTGGR